MSIYKGASKAAYETEVLDHRDGGLLNDKLRIRTSGERTAGNAFNSYHINHQVDGGLNRLLCLVTFQSGNPADGISGVSDEALLAVVIDRLRDFQSGPFASEDNARAAAHISVALDSLQRRTRERAARGVEGIATA